jgi:hypothetical protein
MDLSHAHTPPAEKKRWYRQLYVQVLVAIVLGVVVGAAQPAVGVVMEPIGNAFVRTRNTGADARRARSSRHDTSVPTMQERLPRQTAGAEAVDRRGIKVGGATLTRS